MTVLFPDRVGFTSRAEKMDPVGETTYRVIRQVVDYREADPGRGKGEAESLLRGGRLRAGNEEPGRALAFWWSIGATQYVREGEELLGGVS